MKLRVSFLLALRFLGIGSGASVSNARKSLFGAMLGIGISLIPLLTVLVVADGMIEGISSRIIELATGHLRFADYTGRGTTVGGATASGSTIESYTLEELADQLPRIDFNVKAAVAERQGLGIAIGPLGRSGATLRAVTNSFFDRTAGNEGILKIISGPPGIPLAGEALVGEKLAKTIGVGPGDRFRVLTIHRSASGRDIPKFATRTVRAIVSSGYQELDALWIFVPYASDASLLDSSSAHSFISVYTDNPFGNLEKSRKIILSHLPSGFDSYTWKELNRSQFQSFNTTRTLLLFIMFLILCIASVNVSSALVMLVMERRKEIAIIKSTGATPAGIAFAFILAGFLTGLGGLAVGLPLGILCSLRINQIFALIERLLNLGALVLSQLSTGPVNQKIPEMIHLLDPAYYLQSIPVRIPFPEVFAIAAGTLVLSVLVSVLPALRAGQEKPLDTLRKL